MQYVAITAVGRDRPGIVSEFSGVLFRQGCNLEETTMTRLRDQFAMLLLVRVPVDSFLALDSSLQTLALQMGLSLNLRPLEPGEIDLPAPTSELYMLRVYGGDRPGIVHAVTSLLAERDLNITDLNTRVIPGARGPVYVMMLEIEIPTTEVAEALRPEWERLSRELQVDIAFDALEQEAL